MSANGELVASGEIVGTAAVADPDDGETVAVGPGVVELTESLFFEQPEFIASKDASAITTNGNRKNGMFIICLQIGTKSCRPFPENSRNIFDYLFPE